MGAVEGWLEEFQSSSITWLQDSHGLMAARKGSRNISVSNIKVVITSQASGGDLMVFSPLREIALNFRAGCD